jgi:chromosome partitioning protein
MIISIVNQKGGVGKTVTAVNLAACLAVLGKSVLLVDLDPQANVTSGLGVKKEAGIYEALAGQVSLDEIIVKRPGSNFWLVPSSQSLAGANIELVSNPQREFFLKKLLDLVRTNYDFIIIDSPPSLGLLTLNTLVAADKILIPVQAEYYALEGLGQLLNTINLVRENLRPDLDILGAVITMYDSRSRLSEEVWRELYKHFPSKIFRTIIPRNIRLAEAPSFGKTILEYAPKSRGAKAYHRLAREILAL